MILVILFSGAFFPFPFPEARHLGVQDHYLKKVGHP